MRTSTAQLAGADNNYDRVLVTSNAVVVLDGASEFRPVPVSPDAYVDQLGDALVKLLTTDPQRNLVDALSMAITECATRLNLRPHLSPSSTVSIVRRTDNVIDVLVLGDSPVITPHGIITDSRLDQLNLPEQHQYITRLSAGAGHDDEHHAILVELQKGQAAQRNQAGGYWIAEADPVAARKAVTAELTAIETPWCVIATDGAFEPIRHLGKHTWSDIAHATESDLAAILTECHSWEVEVDPHARLLPRAKRHDDKTLASIIF